MRRYMTLMASAVLLAGCGGGDDTPAADDSPKLGEILVNEVLVDGKLVEQTRYRVYAIDKAGKLVTTADNLIDQFYLPVKVAQTKSTHAQLAKDAPVAEADVVEFFPRLWQALAKRWGVSDPAKIAKEVYDLDIPLDQIYEAYLQSGLTLDGFVDFHETIDDYPFLDAQDSAEADLDLFLKQTKATPAQLLDVLASMQLGWRDLLDAMVQQEHSFQTLLGLYNASGANAHDFVVAYMHLSVPKAMYKGDPASAIAAEGIKAAVEAAKLGFQVVKFGWDVIKENRPVTAAEGAFTRVFSVKDPNWENYVGAKAASSQTVELLAQNLFRGTLVRAKFALTGYYNARSEKFGGYWLPMINMDVSEAYAMWTWKLGAKAKITLPINVGTIAEPIAEVPVFLETNHSGLFQNYTDRYIFKANGKTGFSYGG